MFWCYREDAEIQHVVCRPYEATVSQMLEFRTMRFRASELGKFTGIPHLTTLPLALDKIGFQCRAIQLKSLL